MGAVSCGYSNHANRFMLSRLGKHNKKHDFVVVQLQILDWRLKMIYEVIGYEHRKGTSRNYGDYDKVIVHCKTESIDVDGHGDRVEQVFIDMIRNPQELPVPAVGDKIVVYYNRRGYPSGYEIR